MDSNEWLTTSRKKMNNGQKSIKAKQQAVLFKVNEMFASTFESEIIKCVLQHFNWEIHPAIDVLLKMKSEREELPLQQQREYFEFFDNGNNYSNSIEPKLSTDEEIKGFFKQQDEFPQHEQAQQGNFYQNRKEAYKTHMGLGANKFQQVTDNEIDNSVIDKCAIDMSSIDSNNRPAKIIWLSESEVTSNVDSEDDSFSVLKVIQNFDSTAKTRCVDDSVPQRCAIFVRDKDNSKVNEQSNRSKAIFDDFSLKEKNCDKACAKEMLNTSSLASEDFIAKYCEREMKTRTEGPLYSRHPSNQCSVKSTDRKGNSYKGEMCGLKVEYRSRDLQSSSDDDADVVIEEESSEYNLEMSAATPINVCQFLSSITQSPPQGTRPKISMIQTPSPPSTPARNAVSRIAENIRSGYKVLIILRGLPGSGKSYLAKSIVLRTVGSCDPTKFIFSTDNYFFNKGVYKFVSLKLEEAHRWNQSKVLKAAQEGRSPIIIDNTNTQLWEMMPYANVAVNNGYYLEILEPGTSWAQNPVELSRRNVHDIPKTKIQQMLDRYEKNITGYKLMQRFNLSYAPGNRPPQMRSYPPLSVQKDDAEEDGEEEVEQAKPKGMRKRRGRGSSRRRAMAFLMKKNEAADEITKEYNSINEANRFENESQNFIVDHWGEKEVEDEKIDTKSTIGISENIFHDSSKYNVADTQSKNSQSCTTLQNLGAIGSERKFEAGSLNATQFQEERGRNENVLSQCWDFTLLLDGKQIHSVASPEQARDCWVVERYKHKDENIWKNKVFVNYGSLTFLVDVDEVQNMLNSYNAQITQNIESDFLVTENVIKKPSSMAQYIDTVKNDKPFFDSMINCFTKSSISSEKVEDAKNKESSDDKSDIFISQQPNAIVDTLTKKLPNSKDSQESTASCTQETFFSLHCDEPAKVLPQNFISHKLSCTATNSVNLACSTLNTEVQDVVNLEDFIERDTRSSDDLKEIFHFSEKPDEPLKMINQKNDENVNFSVEKILTTVNALSKDLRTIDSKENEDKNEKKVNMVDELHLNYILKKLLSSSEMKEDSCGKIDEAIDNINQITWKESPFPVSDLPLPQKVEEYRQVQTVEASTNTCAYDFNVSYVGGTSEPQYKVLRSFNRSINENFVLSNLDLFPQPKLMLHKSSMTDDLNIYYEGSDSNEETESKRKDRTDELAEMFPHIPRDYISEVYKNVYDYDFNWAVEFLLEGVPEDIIKYQNVRSPKLDFVNSMSSSTKKSDNKKSLQSQINSSSRKKEKNQISEEALALQRHLEEKVKVKEASYHPHILRVKRWKNREIDMSDDEIEAQVVNKDAIEFATSSWNNDIGLAGTSGILDMSSTSGILVASGNSSNDVAGTIINEDDYDDDDDDDYDDFKDDESDSDSEEMELNLGKDFINTLEKEFGDPQFRFPEGLSPVIQIKKSMAREFFALWIESMQQQFEKRQQQLDEMMAKDAEYAKFLEAEEAKIATESKVPSLSEIMDMEMALAIYNNDLKQKMQRETPNDLAARLTRELLHELFPTAEQQMLNEILTAHNGNFEETIKILKSNIGTQFSNQDALNKQKLLMDQVKRENVNSNTQKRPLIVINPVLNVSSTRNRVDFDEMNGIVEDSRKEGLRQFGFVVANKFLSTQAYENSKYELHSLYEGLVDLHKLKMQQAHLKASSTLLAIQAYQFSDSLTLDLHKFHKWEALEVLDIFLERKWQALRYGNKSCLCLNIITGRGARSANGVSVLKPAIINKLRKEGIIHSEHNQGCLKVKLYKQQLVRRDREMRR